MSLGKKIAYGKKVLPGGTWRALSRRVHGPVHLMIAVADHFEPAIVPGQGDKRAPMGEQERRLESWHREYPKVVDRWRDYDGHPFAHTYFYPAEQYDGGLLDRIAEHCHAGWGEVEVHLHHGMSEPDTAENTRRLLVEFRDRLAFQHRCLAAQEGSSQPRYAFVHGNFALANSAGGRFCGVDSEMKILADTGCYADFTLPTGHYHPAQTAKINSLYECDLPLDETAPHREGNDLTKGRPPRIFPLMIQGPLLVDFGGSRRALKPIFETGAITESNPINLRRFALQKRARVHVHGRPDWLFIKMHCHSMNPKQRDAVVGDPFRSFLEKLVGGAAEREEKLHFVTAREMANIILAACDGKDGNPGEYRDYRFKLLRDLPIAGGKADSVPVNVG